ncbi:MAG TPA: hypothetical protein VGN60_05185 [Devosia sp.]|jgi:hypothetical protein|nr:hypothetical protein [Devosia sp.]
MTDFSHRIPLQIAAADYAGRAMEAPVDDERICFGIVHTHLQLASAYPARQLEQLYAQWNRMHPVHPAYDRAICIVLEHLDLVMRPAGLLESA